MSPDQVNDLVIIIPAAALIAITGLVIAYLQYHKRRR